MKKKEIKYKKPMVCPACQGSGYLNRPRKFVIEIIRLKHEGLTYRQIGKILGCAPNTAHYHYHRWIENPELEK